MKAVSVISTMKVDCPPARSSDAPILVKILSLILLRRSAGTYSMCNTNACDLSHVGRFSSYIWASD